jgi:hypothetical protein
VKPTFEELLAKYKNKGASQKQEGGQVKVKIQNFQKKSKYTLLL